ncbi:MAG: ABC transporter substrate-binding protein [Dehalococcoidia bacterium]
MTLINRLIGHRLIMLVMIAMVAAVLTAACGDDDDETLKIGFLNAFSGPLAEFGPAIQTGVELAIEHINAAGGVLGNDVVFVTGDTQVDATQGIEEARRLVEIEGVHAIVGPLASSVALAVSESVTADARIPVISPSATSPALSTAPDNGYLFRSTISDAAQGVVLAQLATDEGFDNVAVLFLNDAYGQGLAEAFENAFGGTVTKASFEDGAASYLAELQAAADGGSDVLVAIGFPPQAEIFIREALENDIFSKFLFVDGTKSEDLIEAIGAENLEGFKGTAPGAGPESAALQAWNAAYEAKYGALPTLPFVREAYDATIAIALAAQFAGSTDGAAIRDALPKIGNPGGTAYIPGAAGIAGALKAVKDKKDINYEGAATTLDWDANGDVTSGYVGIWRYAGGTIEELEQIPFSVD